MSTAKLSVAGLHAAYGRAQVLFDVSLEIGPGEEILDALFVQYAGQHYKKRVHGPKIAAEMSPPEELAELFTTFMAE